MMSDFDRARRSAVLEGLSDEVIRAMLRRAPVKTLTHPQTLYAPGDRASFFGLVLAGTLDRFIINRDGRTILLGSAEQGAPVGLDSLALDAPRQTLCQAGSIARLLVISRSVYNDLRSIRRFRQNGRTTPALSPAAQPPMLPE